MACPSVGCVCSQETRSTPGLCSRPGSDSRKEGGGGYPSLEKQFPESCKQPKAIRPQGNLGHSPVETIKLSNVLKTIQEVAKFSLRRHAQLSREVSDISLKIHTILQNTMWAMKR